MSHGTYKPCPGCGGTGWRYATRVCDECQKMIALGRAHKVAEETAETAGPLTRFRMRSTWPGFTFVRGQAEGKDLCAAFINLSRRVLRVSRKQFEDPFNPSPDLIGERGQRIYFSTQDEKAIIYEGTKSAGDALDRLDWATREALKAAWHDGQKEGRAMLVQLARGEITMAQLSEETIEALKGTRRK